MCFIVTWETGCCWRFGTEMNFTRWQGGTASATLWGWKGSRCSVRDWKRWVNIESSAEFETPPCTSGIYQAGAATTTPYMLVCLCSPASVISHLNVLSSGDPPARRSGVVVRQGGRPVVLGARGSDTTLAFLIHHRQPCWWPLRRPRVGGYKKPRQRRQELRGSFEHHDRGALSGRTDGRQRWRGTRRRSCVRCGPRARGRKPRRRRWRWRRRVCDPCHHDLQKASRVPGHCRGAPGTFFPFPNSWLGLGEIMAGLLRREFVHDFRKCR